MYFKDVRRTKHYTKEHEHEVPWRKVLDLIYETKDHRKVGNVIVIKDRRFYVVCVQKNGILYVINAKKNE